MKPRPRFSRVILVLWFLAGFTALGAELLRKEKASLPASGEVVTEDLSKLDASLRLGLRDRVWRDRTRTLKPSAGEERETPLMVIERAANGAEIVPLFIKTRDVEKTKAAVTALGGTISVSLQKHLVARIPIEKVTELESLDEIERVEASHDSRYLLDTSLREIKADQVHAGTVLGSPFTGRGIIVGVIDSGIDWSHADFKNSSGQTRILSIWDQTTSGKPPAGFSRGYECTSAEINASQCPERDTNGHGTHVSSIAAGNGRARSSTFMGVAPEADIIMVKADPPSSTNVVEGLSYIFGKAQSLGKPVVVNLSLGGHFGPHDGTSLYERSVSDFLGAGKQIVVANGNEGDTRIHAGYDTRGSNYQTGISTYWNAAQSSSLVDMWSDSPSISVGVAAGVVEGGQLRTVFVSQPISSGELARTEVRNGATVLGYVTVATETAPGGGKHAIALLDNGDNPSINLSNFVWEFYTFGSGRVDAWIASGGVFDPFTDVPGGYIGGDFNMTVGLPATAANVVAVGSYVTKLSWTDVDGQPRSYDDEVVGRASSFTSLGPTRDNRRRPIVAAPGQGIAAALGANSEQERPYFLQGGSYRIMQGTSQASPHVTGLLALMLQAKPNLTPAETYTSLRGKARKDGNTGGSPNNTYGDGKIDALESVREVAGSTPPTGPCVPGPATLCLNKGRFRVQTSYRTSAGTTGNGQAVALTADTGYFWFFSSTNVEMVIKLLDACVFGRYWVFSGGLTDVEVITTVTDTNTGVAKTYTNPLGRAFQPIQDTNAFATCP